MGEILTDLFPISCTGMNRKNKNIYIYNTKTSKTKNTKKQKVGLGEILMGSFAISFIGVNRKSIGLICLLNRF